MTGRMPWRRRREVSLALASRKERPPQDLRRAYGRASATIGEQRGTIARLRTTIRQMARWYDHELLWAEALADAIGAPGCTPDYVLHVAKRAGRSLAADDGRWMALVAGTPGVSPSARDVDTLTKAQQWGDELAPTTSPVGGEDAAAASVPAATGDSTPGDTRAAVAQLLTDHELLADSRITGSTWQAYVTAPAWPDEIKFCAVVDHESLTIDDFLGIADQIGQLVGGTADDVEVQGVGVANRDVFVTLTLRCPVTSSVPAEAESEEVAPW